MGCCIMIAVTSPEGAGVWALPRRRHTKSVPRWGAPCASSCWTGAGASPLPVLLLAAVPWAPTPLSPELARLCAGGPLDSTRCARCKGMCAVCVLGGGGAGAYACVTCACARAVPALTTRLALEMWRPCSRRRGRTAPPARLGGSGCCSRRWLNVAAGARSGMSSVGSGVRGSCKYSGLRMRAPLLKARSCFSRRSPPICLERLAASCFL